MDGTRLLNLKGFAYLPRTAPSPSNCSTTILGRDEMRKLFLFSSIGYIAILLPIVEYQDCSIGLKNVHDQFLFHSCWSYWNIFSCKEGLIWSRTLFISFKKLINLKICAKLNISLLSMKLKIIRVIHQEAANFSTSEKG